jgi:hypothetical protein
MLLAVVNAGFVQHTHGQILKVENDISLNVLIILKVKVMRNIEVGLRVKMLNLQAFCGLQVNQLYR